MKNIINHIEISNFKSIRQQFIEGCRKINLFIGYPNVGKSNILEAIGSVGFFQYTDVKRVAYLSDLIRVESISNVFFDCDNNTSSIVCLNNKCCFRFYPHIFQRDDKLILSFDYNSKQVIELSFDNQFAITRSFAEKVERFDEFDKDIVQYEIPDVKKYHFDKKRTINRERSLSQMFDGSANLFFPFGENLMEVLSKNNELRKAVSDLFERYELKLVFDKVSQSLKITKLYEDNSIALLPYNLIADTLQRLIFYKAAIKSNENTVLLFEEPEAHMFPPYIRDFTADVMFDKTNQFFIATHSPDVLNTFLDEAFDNLAIYLVDYKNGETVIQRLSDSEMDEIKNNGVDLFFNIESYLKNGEVNNA